MPDTNFEIAPVHPSDGVKNYYARRLESGTIMVVREKHSTRYFKASTLREFCAAALFLLDERWGAKGYWGTADEQIKEYEGCISAITKPELTIDQLFEKTGLSPASQVTLELARQWDEYNTRVQEYTWTLGGYRRIKAAIEGRNGLAAAQIMNDRQDHEYEGWQFEQIEAPLEKRR